MFSALLAIACFNLGCAFGYYIGVMKEREKVTRMKFVLNATYGRIGHDLALKAKESKGPSHGEWD